MKKLSLILISVLLLGAPAMAMEFPEGEPMETVGGISLSVNGSTIHVTGAQGEVLEVFSLTGAKVTTLRIDSADKSLNMNLAKGCYILKIGKVIRKVSIQ